MDSIKRLSTETSAIALQLTGLTYKVKLNGKVSEEQLEMMNALTDKVSDNMVNIKKECVSIETNAAQRNSRIENLSRDNAVYKRKLGEAQLEVEQLTSQNKKLKEELNCSQEALGALSFEEGFEDSQKDILKD